MLDLVWCRYELLRSPWITVLFLAMLHGMSRAASQQMHSEQHIYNIFIVTYQTQMTVTGTVSHNR